MDEKDLNRAIVRSFDQILFGHKISDEASSYVSTSKKPFDYFAVTPDFVVFGESKLIKGMYAFNFNRLADHQIDSLRRTARIRRENSNVPVYSVVSIGLWAPRKYFYVLFFDIDFLYSLIVANDDRKSITGKELSRIVNEKPSCVLHVKKGVVENIEKLPDSIIYELPV